MVLLSTAEDGNPPFHQIAVGESALVVNLRAVKRQSALGGHATRLSVRFEHPRLRRHHEHRLAEDFAFGKGCGLHILEYRLKFGGAFPFYRSAKESARGILRDLQSDSPWTSAVSSSAKALCGIRASGFAFICASSDAISSNDFSENTFR